MNYELNFYLTNVMIMIYYTIYHEEVRNMWLRAHELLRRMKVDFRMSMFDK